jgi:membrane peptidoglycan carboxypeptidase
MPSKIYSDSENTLASENSIKAQDDSTRKSLLLPKEEVDETEMGDILDEDGHLVARSVRVVKTGSKVGTEFSRQAYTAESLEKEASPIGKKDSTKIGASLQNIRSKLGFSWNKFGRQTVLIGLALGIIIIIGVSGVAAWAVGIWNNTNTVETTQAESSVVYARDGKTELFKFYKDEKREVVLIDADAKNPDQNYIPRNMQLAMIALEDENFYYNEDGIPWSNIVGAAFKCLTTAGDNCRGASGLAQQLRKNLTKEDDPTLSRKIEELFAAIKLNREMNKKTILELYLNQVFFGRNSAGVQEASRSYFGKDIKNITTTEACYLAALVQQPGIFSASIGKPDDPANVEYIERKNICLQKMHERKLEGDNIPPFIGSSEELDKLKQEQVQFTDNRQTFPYPHFRDYVTQELRKFNINEQALYTRGYRIITTLDPDIQAKTEKSIGETIQGAVFDNGANNTAAIVLDGPSGQIMAMVGSRDYYDESIDGQVNIMTSPRQPGSSIKPYVYACAFNQNFNPGTILINKPTDFGGGFRPKNYTPGLLDGPISIRSALQNSLNITAVKAGYLCAGSGNLPDERKSLNNFFDYSETLGLRYPCIPNADNKEGEQTCANPQYAQKAYRNRCYVGTFIGGCEVSGVSHATALNVFAQNGNLRTATPFVSVIDPKTGTDLYTRTQNSDNPIYPVKEAVIKPGTAQQINSIMSDYPARYPAFGRRLAANLELTGWTGANAVAAKTGTTDNVKDTWAVGYSPYYTVVTWVGNTDSTPLKNTAAASSAAAPIWNRIMTNLHENKEKKGFSKDQLKPVRLDPLSGFIVNEGGNVEYLTDEQIKALNDAQALMAKPDYNPSGQSIFQNRSSIVLRNLKVNNLDGKLAVDGKTLSSSISTISCTDSISEFPLAKNWLEPSIGLIGDKGKRCPTELSDQDQVSEQNNKPQITTTLTSGGSAGFPSYISAVPTGLPGKSISSILVYVDGVQKDVTVINGQGAFYGSDVTPGTHNVLIRATDSFGAVNEITINNVNFGAPSFNITSSGNASSLTLTATPNITTTLSSPEFRIYQNGNETNRCTAQLTGGLYTCTINAGGQSGGATVRFLSGGSTLAQKQINF